MKITRILPKPLAKEFQRYSLNRYEGELAYYRARVRVLEELVQEGYDELNRLEGK